MEGLDSVFLSDRTTHQPVRSVSLPTRIHPLSFKLRSALNRLSIWKRSSSSVSVSASFGSETLLVGLANLADLYGCVHELLESPYVRNTLRHHQKGKLLEDSLNGSVVLLDVCEAAREVIVTMREHMMDLKSALRRKGSVEKEAKAYINVRKKAKKEISKHINGLKKMETRDISTNIDQDPAIASTSVLRETLEISVSILMHLLLFLSTTPPPSPARKIKNIISLFPIPLASSPLAVSDLIKEAKSLDDIFLGSIVNSRRTFSEVEKKNKRRDVVEESFGDLEAELDSVFKCLVKNRVLFLNILSDC
ncbi:Selection/upkeep of intraepithelial T-cells protein [Hirschfeldia incana]|nr:Selection/upkeep of intraepithelial T-cells protein [Hirschfeldia incana]